MIVFRKRNEIQAETGLVNHPPLFPDIGVICLVPDQWHKYWESRHHIISRLCRYFNILWINPAREWREIWHAQQPPLQDSAYEGATPPDFAIYQPEKWLPKLYRPNFVVRKVERLRLRRASEFLQNRGCKKIILYLWRPEYALTLDLIPHDASCYHIDDEYAFSKTEVPLQENEAGLISRVDSVFIHSPPLMEKKGKINPRTIFTPNGVDYAHWVKSFDEPDDMKAIPRPRIGYIGKIKKHLDYPLLLALAQKHKEWSFVFVGPEQKLRERAPLAKRLSQLPNVYFLGTKPFEKLPAYARYFDVCMLCYELNGYTKYIYPLKLHEYLASGRPVVGTPIPIFQEFAEAIRIAATSEKWSEAIAESLSPSHRSQESILLRRKIARQYDWNIIVARIARSLCKCLGSLYIERIEDISHENVLPFQKP